MKLWLPGSNSQSCRACPPGYRSSPPSARPTPEAERQQPNQRGAASEILSVFAVQGTGVAGGVLGGGIALLTGGSAAAHAAPAHRAPVRSEAVAMSEHAARDHAGVLPVRPDLTPIFAGAYRRDETA